MCRTCGVEYYSSIWTASPWSGVNSCYRATRLDTVARTANDCRRYSLRLELFMRFPVPQVMIIVLLIHTALGCCWHHAHQCATNCCDSPPAVVQACPCHTHQTPDRTLSHERPEGDHHRHEHNCDGDRCTFLRSEQSSEECVGRSLDVAFVFWDTSLGADSSIRPPCTGISNNPSSGCAPPIRSHLLLSVLLI